MSKFKSLWDSISDGYEIPVLIKRPNYMQLFMFSAVTWNRHLVHYNSGYARHDGFADVAVHRALIGNFLVQMLNNWIGDAGKVTKVEWKVKGAAVPGDTLTCRGKDVQILAQETQKLIECELWIVNQRGEITTQGKGEVVFF